VSAVFGVYAHVYTHTHTFNEVTEAEIYKIGPTMNPRACERVVDSAGWDGGDVAGAKGSNAI